MRGSPDSYASRHARPVYSIATLVTDPDQHAAMTASFIAGGFTTDDCEYLHVDNTGADQTSAYTGLNRMLNDARGGIVILCHQDVRLIDDRATLTAKLTDLDTRDPDWAVAGNAGGAAPGRLAIRITDPHGSDRSIGDLPARVTTLDENLLIVKANTRVGFSNDLDGFHFYGADLCLVADVLGYTSYVINFHIEHLSPGRKDKSFDEMQARFRNKWSHAFRPRWLQTTCSLIRLTGAPGSRYLAPIMEWPVEKIARKRPGAAGWEPEKAS